MEINRDKIDKYEYYFPFVACDKSILIKIITYYTKIDYPEYLTYLALFSNKIFGYSFDYDANKLKNGDYFLVYFGKFESFNILKVEEKLNIESSLNDFIYIELDQILPSDKIIE